VATPPTVVTTTSCWVPAVPAGEKQVRAVSLATLMDVQAAPPIVTLDTTLVVLKMKPVPVIVTMVPPPEGPAEGLTDVIVGGETGTSLTVAVIVTVEE